MNLDPASPLPSYELGQLENASPDAPIDLAAAPPVPTNLATTGVSEQTLRNLTIKIAYSAYNYTTDWAAERLRLPIHGVSWRARFMARP